MRCENQGVDARYSRQLALPGFGLKSQQALGAARVLVIGAGGLGSAVIPALAGAGVGTIGIIDDDRVELSNLHRQLMHGVADIGSQKVASAAATIAALNPQTNVVTYAERLTSATALERFADYDLVIDGSDNFPTRYLSNDAAAITGIPLVWGAVSQFNGQVGVAWAERGPTYRDLFPTPPPADSVLSCERGGVLPTVVGTIGSLMATEAIKIITGIGEPLIGRVNTVDALNGTVRSLAYQRDPLAAPITELIDYALFCGVPAETLQEVQSATEVSATEVSATEVTAAVPLIDVREPWEAEIASIPGSILVPLGTLASDPAGAIAAAATLETGKPLVVYCHHGIRSATGRELLERSGIAASHLLGGIDAWASDIDSAMARY